MTEHQEADVVNSAATQQETPGATAPAEAGDAHGYGFLLRRWRTLVIVLSVLLVLLLAAAAVVGVSWSDSRQHARDRVTVSKTAERAARTLVTIGADNAKKHIGALLEDATGQFRDQLSGFSELFQTVLKQGRVSSEGTVTASGVERLDDRRAVVLIAVSAEVRNTQIEQGAPRRYRIAVTLDRVGDTWLVSAMNFVG